MTFDYQNFLGERRRTERSFTREPNRFEAGSKWSVVGSPLLSALSPPKQGATHWLHSRIGRYTTRANPWRAKRSPHGGKRVR